MSLLYQEHLIEGQEMAGNIPEIDEECALSLVANVNALETLIEEETHKRLGIARR